jgi:hypothetical protein
MERVRGPSCHGELVFETKAGIIVAWKRCGKLSECLAT